MDRPERRRHPRVAIDLPLRLTFQDRTIESRIRDLSRSGIRFGADAPMALLSRVQIALDLPVDEETAGAPLAINGVVVRCDETAPGAAAAYDLAIYFEDLSDRAATRLSRFVDGLAG